MLRIWICVPARPAAVGERARASKWATHLDVVNDLRGELRQVALLIGTRVTRACVLLRGARECVSVRELPGSATHRAHELGLLGKRLLLGPLQQAELVLQRRLAL
jgi:hypothetical protein